ncbi:MAG TPA: NACHT domain-containing protein [Bryobacteraceae bacterium]|nr:NACHT domain-containing protein [Bryobacteraceae bacterium]
MSTHILNAQNAKVAIEADQIRDQLARMLQDEIFARSDLLSRFLEVVVGEALAGNTPKASFLLEEVFKSRERSGTSRKSSGEKTDDETKVRVEAGRLRQKLLQYYSGPGANDPILIEIPRGGYSPVFQLRSPQVAPEKLKPVPTVDQRDRSRMLQRVRLDWIEGLKRSLYQIARLELRLETAEDAVARNLLVQVPQQSPVPIPAGRTIGRVFDDLGQALLILGAPGSGKTTLLLELAQELLDRAEQDDGQPIPVVFNLSSWAVRREPLERWLIAELNERSGVPKKRAKQWVESDQIAPLLDGLDEVAAEHREACVLAINQFRQERGFLPIAICSRMGDYEQLSTKLRLQNAVLIQSLTRAQVEMCLLRAGDSLKGLCAALEYDPALWELLETPLMLWIAMLAYRDAPAVFSAEETFEQRRTQLLAHFVDAMFERRAADARYSRRQTMHWLSSLARAMVRLKQSVFYLESLNADWLPRERNPLFRLAIPPLTAVAAPIIPFACYCFFLVGVYIVGDVLKAGPHPPFWVPMSLGLIVLTVSAVGLGIYLFFFSRNLAPVERVRWRPVKLRSVFISWIVVLCTVLLFLFSFIIYAEFYLLGEFDAPATGFWSTLRQNVDLPVDAPPFLFAAVALTFLIKGLKIEQPTGARPNEGTRSSARNALRFGLLSGIAVALSVIAIPTFGTDPVPSRYPLGDALSNAIAGALIGLFVGFVVGLLKGGAFALRNLFTRLALWASGAAPLRYVRLLDFATDRLFLQRVGGGYTFIHRMVLEYFASLPESDKAAS